MKTDFSIMDEALEVRAEAFRKLPRGEAREKFMALLRRISERVTGEGIYALDAIKFSVTDEEFKEVIILGRELNPEYKEVKATE